MQSFLFRKKGKPIPVKDLERPREL